LALWPHADMRFSPVTANRKSGMSQDLVDPSKPIPRPDWVQGINDEGRLWAKAGMLRDLVPLDEASLLDSARRMTGLTDFGEDDWREPFRILIRSLEEEAELNLMGRLASRSEILLWLRTRLMLTDLLRRHPEIFEAPVEKPIFIAGLGRSGTSILQELLHQDPALRTPLFWEVYFPVDSAVSGGSNETAKEAGHNLATQWIRVTPQIQTMHEVAGHLPAEDSSLWSFSFVSDSIMSFYQIPTYHEYVNKADADIAYKYHKQILQALQWKQPGRRWFGKSATYHLAHLPTLLKHYPDACLIQTHRDPLRIMSSVANLLRTFYWQRSDRDFDAPVFKDLLVGEFTARQLERVMELRDQGVVPPGQIVDSRYADLMSDPVAAIETIYRAFGMAFDERSAERIRRYLAFKPKDKHGRHDYEPMTQEQIARNRPYFKRYQERYAVPDEI
jgi:hypothetical protein